TACGSCATRDRPTAPTSTIDASIATSWWTTTSSSSAARCSSSRACDHTMMTTHDRRWARSLLLLGIAGAWLAMERPVHAEGSNIEVLLQVKPPDPNNPKTKDDAPQIEARVIGAANLPSDKFLLREEGAKQPIEIKPLTKREYNQGTEKLAIAIVLNGWEIWIGNDDVLPEDDPSRYPGVLKAL